jgi:translation initiation factor IF-3
MNPSVRPIVVRIMDFGRFKYDKQKREKKSKTAAAELKQIKYRPNIDEHDFKTKTDKLRKFLLEGHKVRVTIMFRRRDMRRPENGVRILERVAEDLADVGRADEIPTQVISRDLTLTINPLRQPVKKDEAPDPAAGGTRRQERQGRRQAKLRPEDEAGPEADDEDDADDADDADGEDHDDDADADADDADADDDGEDHRDEPKPGAAHAGDDAS